MRVRLRCTAGSLVGRAFELETPVTIGRDSARCTLALDAAKDPRTSSVHCELIERGGALALRDANSLNGTFVNGVPITSVTVVHPGSVIALGDKGAAFVVEPLAPPKEGVGVATLQREIAKATTEVARTERRRTHALGIALAVVAVAGPLAVWLVASGRLVALEKTEKQQGGAIDTLDGRVAKIGAAVEQLEVRVAASEDEFKKNVTTFARRLREKERDLDDLAARLGDEAAGRGKLASEIEARRREVAAMQENLDAYEERNAALLAKAQAPFKAAAEEARLGVYSVLVMEGEKTRFLATAFAINDRTGLLGTNGHVTFHVEKALAAGKHVVVRANGRPDLTFGVARAITHPVYAALAAKASNLPTNAPDVGILQLDAALPLPCYLRAARPERLARLAAGEPVFVLGFPGVYSDYYELPTGQANVAKLAPGVVSALTTFGASPVTRSFDMIEHTCPTECGNSGSPILTTDGLVVALHNSEVGRTFVTADPSGQLRPELLHVGGVTYGVNALYLVALAREQFGEGAWR